MQAIGPVRVTIDYSSPRVVRGTNDRRGKIWGELVPWGMSDLGFNGCTSCPVARRRQREHHLHDDARRPGPGPEASGRDLRAPLHPGTGRVDRDLLEGRGVLGKLLVRPQERRAAGHDEGRQERVPRVADLRVPDPRAVEGDRGAPLGGPPGAVDDRGRRRQRPLGRPDADGPARLGRLLLAELAAGGGVLRRQQGQPAGGARLGAARGFGSVLGRRGELRHADDALEAPGRQRPDGRSGEDVRQGGQSPDRRPRPDPPGGPRPAARGEEGPGDQALPAQREAVPERVARALRADARLRRDGRHEESARGGEARAGAGARRGRTRRTSRA